MPLVEKSLSIRIVSLVPFATELVCALGAEENLVAVSHACDFPASVKSLPIVTTQTVLPPAQTLLDEDGDSYEVPPSAKEIDDAVRAAVAAGDGLYRIDTAKLLALKPDLVITQGLCDVCAASHLATARAVAELGDSVTVLDLSPTNLTEVIDAFRKVGAATGRVEEADALVSETLARLETVRVSTLSAPSRPRVLLLEWPEPLFCAGHWSPELVEIAGATRAPWDKTGAPSRVIAWDEVLRFDPEVIVLAACGFDTERGAWESTTLSDLPGWFELPAVRSGDCYVVDGNAYFNRPGPRLADSAELLATILHPDTTQNTVPPYSVVRFPNEALNPPV